MKQNVIGGYFGLELPIFKNYPYHRNALELSSGRAAFFLLLKKIKPTKIYIPFYTCSSLLDPLKLQKIPYEFYSIDTSFRPKELIKLAAHDFFLYINYFGLSNKVTEQLFKLFKQKLIVDNTQAFFEKNIYDCWSFNSVRKFFGTPDGAYLYSPNRHKLNVELLPNPSLNIDHLFKRLEGNISLGYKQYRFNEKNITPQIYAMSNLTKIIMKGIDYQKVVETRKQNFKILHEHLQCFNQLYLPDKDDGTPMFYPFLTKSTELRQYLIDQYIYVPQLWPEVKSRTTRDSFEYHLAQNLCPLPIDHRYNINDMLHIVNKINAYYKN